MAWGCDFSFFPFSFLHGRPARVFFALIMFAVCGIIRVSFFWELMGKGRMVMDISSTSYVDADRKLRQELLSRLLSESAREAVLDAFEVADLILFHAMVCGNVENSSRTWDM